MRPAKVPALSLIILAVSVLLILPALSPETDAASTGDVEVRLYADDLKINAGSSASFRIEVVNSLSYIANDLSNSRMVSIELSQIEEVSISVAGDDRYFVLAGQESRPITVNINVGKYAAEKRHWIDITLTVRDLSGNQDAVRTDPVSVGLKVQSPLSSEGTYNKILGIFDNPFPEPFDNSLTAAVITFILVFVIGVLVMIAMTPLLLRAFSLKNKEEGKKLRRGLRTLIPLVLILFAADNSLRVFGAPEGTVGSIESWFAIFYIVFGALIAWVIYLSFVQRTVSRISQSKHIDRKDMDIEPLLRLFGKLIISVMGVAMIMSSLGFNLTAIITSAGIVSLGITLGAQNILNQFFSGMVLLLTHPFKSGDLVRIGNNNVIYRVSSVNIMNTVFENWDNEETVIMPNNAVSSSTIVNVTGGGLTYKIAVFMNVPHDSDVDLARALMAEAATNHPQVLVDGTVDAPSTRVTALLESGIELRLTCYVYDFNDSGKIGGELRDSIFKSFKRNGIKVPYPHIDINLGTADKKDERRDLDD